MNQEAVLRAEKFLADAKEAMIQDICCLVRIESTREVSAPGAPFGPGPAAALETVLSRARRMGMRTKNHGGYVGTADAGPAEPGLDILAHLDVVPGGEGWKVTQPFCPVVSGGRIYGRGAADDKGPAMAVLYALAAVVHTGLELKKRVRIIWGCAEETGAEDIRAYYASHSHAPMTVTPDAAFPVICSEKGRIECHFFNRNVDDPLVCTFSGGGPANAVPSSARAVLAAPLEYVQAACRQVSIPGVSFAFHTVSDRLCEVVVQGKTAHAAAPAAGCNAVSVLIAVIACMQNAPPWVHVLTELFPPQGKAGKEDRPLCASGVTCSLSALELSNGKLNGVCDCRFPFPMKCAVVRDDLFGTLRAGAFLISEDTKFCEAHCVSADSTFVKTLLACCRDAGGPDGEARAIAGNTYAHGIPGAVAFGFSDPTIRTGAHGADEYMDIEQIILGARIYIRAIIELCG